MGILSNIFGQRPSASPDSITFDASRYELQGDHDGTRVWLLPEGGGVGLYFFPSKPDLPAVASTQHLREFYATQMGDRLQVVESRVLPLDGVRSIWLIAKALDEQTRGAVYLGSLTIPFRDFVLSSRFSAMSRALLVCARRCSSRRRFGMAQDGSRLTGSFRLAGLLMTSSSMTGCRSIRFRECVESCDTSHRLFGLSRRSERKHDLIYHRMTPNHALQRTRPSRSGCNRRVPWAGSLSLGR